MTPPIRVLVVDDSAFARKVIRDSLSSSAEIEVVGIAHDGLEALEKIAELNPDVVALDLMMPNLDGLGVLRSLPEGCTSKFVIVSFSDADSPIGAEALSIGAIDLVKKPTALASDRLYEIRDDLVARIKVAARANIVLPQIVARPFAAVSLPQGALRQGTRIVVIGTSTGGPQALSRLLATLPADFPVPIAIALHIPAEYTNAMAARLNETCSLEVIEAVDRVELTIGRIVLARGGSHLEIFTDDAGRLRGKVRERGTEIYAPSVDRLFKSAVAAVQGSVLGVVLTGMGDDGLEGARAIRSAGGRVLAESEESAVIDGMPRVVRQANLATTTAPLNEMAEAIIKAL